MRARTISSASATRTLLRGEDNGCVTSNFTRSRGLLQITSGKRTERAEALFQIICGGLRFLAGLIFDRHPGVIVIERVSAEFAENLILFQVRGAEVTRAESADDFDRLLGHRDHSGMGTPSNSAAIRRIQTVN